MIDYETFKAVYNIMEEKKYIKPIKVMWDTDIYEMIKELNESEV